MEVVCPSQERVLLGVTDAFENSFSDSEGSLLAIRVRVGSPPKPKRLCLVFSLKCSGVLLEAFCHLLAVQNLSTTLPFSCQD